MRRAWPCTDRLVSVDCEDHAAAIVPQLDVSLSEALAYTASLTPGTYTTFRQRLVPAWIEEALNTTGTATLRQRRLPAEQVVWLVIGMALIRDRSITDVARQLDLAMPTEDGMRTVAPSSIAQARARLGVDPMEWLFERTATQWADASADRDRWRDLALYAVDGTTLRVPDSPENRAHFGSHTAGADRDGKDRGPSGDPLAKVVTVMALRSHLLAAACFGPHTTDERQYAKALWSSIPEHSLVLLDRVPRRRRAPRTLVDEPALAHSGEIKLDLARDQEPRQGRSARRDGGQLRSAPQAPQPPDAFRCPRDSLST